MCRRSEAKSKKYQEYRRLMQLLAKAPQTGQFACSPEARSLVGAAHYPPPSNWTRENFDVLLLCEVAGADGNPCDSAALRAAACCLCPPLFLVVIPPPTVCDEQTWSHSSFLLLLLPPTHEER